MLSRSSTGLCPRPQTYSLTQSSVYCGYTVASFVVLVSFGGRFMGKNQIKPVFKFHPVHFWAAATNPSCYASFKKELFICIARDSTEIVLVQ